MSNITKILKILIDTMEEEKINVLTLSDLKYYYNKSLEEEKINSIIKD